MRLAVFLALPVIMLFTAACMTPAPASSAPRSAFADENGDPVRGRVYAQDHCASCHAIRSGDTFSRTFAPTFQQIADTPGFTRIALGAWLRSSHQEMPDFVVESEHIDDIYVYLETLRAHSPRQQ